MSPPDCHAAGRLLPSDRLKRHFTPPHAPADYYQRLAMKSAAARQRRNLICQTCGQPKEAEAPVCPRCLRKLRA